MGKQLEMKLPTWGGKRKGAGRKPKGENAGVAHDRRPEFKARHPVHVTMRMLSGVGFLRGFKFKQAIEDALRAAKERFGMRVVHYSIQGNQILWTFPQRRPGGGPGAPGPAGRGWAAAALTPAPRQALRPRRAFQGPDIP